MKPKMIIIEACKPNMTDAEIKEVISQIGLRYPNCFPLFADVYKLKNKKQFELFN